MFLLTAKLGWHHLWSPRITWSDLLKNRPVKQKVKVTVVDNRQTSACCYPALLTYVNLTEGKV